MTCKCCGTEESTTLVDESDCWDCFLTCKYTVGCLITKRPPLSPEELILAIARAKGCDPVRAKRVDLWLCRCLRVPTDSLGARPHAQPGDAYNAIPNYLEPQWIIRFIEEMAEEFYILDIYRPEEAEYRFSCAAMIKGDPFRVFPRYYADSVTEGIAGAWLTWKTTDRSRWPTYESDD